jgi:DNA polymerase-3 subunit gamma/tau
MLDQMVAFCGNKIEESDVLDIFGFNSEETVAKLADALISGNNSTALELVHEQAEAGKDLAGLLGDLIAYFRNVLVKRVDPGTASDEISPEMQTHIAKHAGLVETHRLLGMIDHLAETDGKMKWAANKKLHVEIAMIKAIQSLSEASLDDVISMISGAASSAGSVPAAAAPAQQPAPESKAAAPAPSSQKVEELSPQPVSKPSSPPPESSPEAPEHADPAPSLPSSTKGPPFWEEAKAKLIEDRPLFSMWLEATHFIDHSDDQVVIGFSPDQRIYKDSLMRHEQVINDTLSQCVGSPTKIRMEVRDDLESIVPEEEAGPETSAGSPPFDPGDSSGSPVGKAADPAPGEEVLQPLEPAEMPEDFYNDPLINDAVDIFDAKIKK